MDFDGRLSDAFFISEKVRKGCCLLLTAINLYTHDMWRKWKTISPTGIQLNKFLTVNFLIHADPIIIIEGGEDELQRSFYQLARIAEGYLFKISGKNSETIAFKGKYPVRITLFKIITLEQVSHFEFLGSNVRFRGEIETKYRINTFKNISVAINRNFGN